MTEALERVLLGLWNSYRRDLKYRDCSDETLQTYCQSITQFAVYMRDRPVDDLDDVEREHVRDWLVSLQQAGRKPNTVHTRFRNIRSFFIWLEKEEELAGPAPTRGLSEPVVKQQPVKVLPLEDVRAMIATCQPRTFMNLRDEAIIRAFYECGPRLAELTRLEEADADLDQMVFWVKGKGGRMRAAPFTNKTASAIDRYLRARRRHRKAATSSRLWLGPQGPLTREGIRFMVGRRGDLAGIGHVHPHKLRHTSAHRLRLAGMSDEDMMRIFGWRSREMLGRYGESAADERALVSFRRFAIGDEI